MREKVKESKKAVTRPISLFPAQLTFANSRANSAGNFSRYIQLLVDYDKKHNILPAALVEGLNPETEVAK